jgi:hypothetical protein
MRAEAGKTGLIDLWLACPIEKLYGFEGLGVVQEAFQGRIGPENAVRMVGAALRVIPDLDMLTSIPVETFNRYGYRLFQQHNENDRAESGHFKYA